MPSKRLARAFPSLVKTIARGWLYTDESAALTQKHRNVVRLYRNKESERILPPIISTELTIVLRAFGEA
jgi:hypothetical protein